MEEQAKVIDEVKVEVVEEKKKKFFTKKKVLAIGGTVAALVLGAVLLAKKGKDGDLVENQNQFVDATYEPVSNSEIIE
jgi:hypothetical protein